MARRTIDVVVPGRMIIDTVKKLAGDHFVIKSEYDKGREVFSIGQKSRHSSGSFIIQAEGENRIDPKKQYEKISVVDHHWEGILFDSDGGAVARGVDAFSDKLRKSLTEKLDK